ncbi:MY9AA-like protein [Mya arenaria]|uniref:MY9AA-like protein n=1 Tax=Mya arenaria TaxID=6604 RepID=A0ABY7DP91_MYAAR|nr:MY9AA-like protein [Mya arenaria]
MALSPIVPPVVVAISAAPGRRMSTETYMVRIYTGPLSQELDFISVEAEKITPAEEVVRVAARKMHLLEPKDYEIAEVFSTAGQLCKERRLGDLENPVRIQLLWPKIVNAEYDPLADQGFTGYRFYIRKKNPEISKRTSSWMEFTEPNPVDNFLTAFLKQPTSNKEYSDLCNLPDLNERTLLENIKSRFLNSNIYTYVGSILIAVNPFKFFPIYNPKYVKMYQNKRLGDLPPHIFAIADAAFYTMLRTKRNQCIVISGESGSGKTESTNLLLHHLTALSHKGLHGSGVEQTILGAGPVLEAFGNAKTVHNNNSSRFGKFIQVNYKENGMVHGAIVEKYLLEKSRIVSQASNERNYHVFYYLLEGAEDLEREKLHLGKPTDYFYLQQSDRDSVEEEDEANEFSRLKQSMEIVGFSQLTQKRIFGVLSAVLHLGNVTFKKTIDVVSRLLMVKKKTLEEALTQKKTIAGDETVVMTHRMEHAVATRDAMAKCLYGALFDWIVLKVNQALLAKRHNSEHQDFRWNSFEQFCINYANEHLQYYFNQHIFKFEQEEYKKEGIQWMNIEFIDNTGCLELFSKKGKGLFSLLDEECNFPGATNDTLLSKFHHHHARGNVYYEAPQKREMAFTVVHYAGRDFREKNRVDPVAVLRWTIIKTLIKSVFAFKKAGIVFRKRGGPDEAMKQRRKHPPTDGLNIPTLDSSHFLSPSHSPTHPKRTAPRSSPLHDNHSHHEPQEFTFSDDDDMYLSPKRNSTGALRSPVEQYLSADEARVMRRATRVLMKNKSFKPKTRPQTMFSDIKTLKAIANRTIYIGGKVNSKQKPPSVGAQFQWSLRRLMSALNQANPFFIRCIKSNAEKLPCRFDEVLVLRQLRYTGMLATVRIRQSGYNYRLTFEVFLREAEKMYIDECLHCAIMKRVITLQRWVKTKVERKNFLQLRENTVIIQKNVRQFLARRREAVLCIQRVYRGWCVRREFRKKRNIAIRIQAHFKGNLGRKRSSGIHDDSESDTLSEVKSRGESIGTPPHTPTSLGTPDIRVEPSPRVKEEFLGQAGQGSRVSKLAEKFQSPDKAGTDDDSPTSLGSSLSPEQIQHIEDSLRKPLDPGSGGRKKKDSLAEDSDDEMDPQRTSPVSKHSLHSMGGINVLPHLHHHPLSPKSPQQETSPGFPEDEKGKAIEKKRRTRKEKGEKDKENSRPPDLHIRGKTKWQYPEEFVIKETWELQALDKFINEKISQLCKETGRESQFDVEENKPCNMKYRDLFVNFENTMEATCAEEQVTIDFPVTLTIKVTGSFKGSSGFQHFVRCVQTSSGPLRRDMSVKRIVGTKVFGVPLHRMVGPDDKTPVFMDRIIVLIETHGIYTEGIYRKSGSAAKIKALKMLLDSGFVMFSLVERIPKVNHDVLERLIFHLARVVLHERNNKMSVNGLAIIFAPCLLRTNRNVQAQEMLTQVSRQQVCIEKILSEQVRKLKTTLQDINTLESAEQTATERLSVVRASIRGEKTAVRHHTEVRSPASVSEDAEILEEQERVISSHIQSIQKEKEDLTTALPTFEYRHSSDDEMLSADDVESLVEDVDYRPDEPTFDTPAKTVSHLSHLTKHRVDTPARHPPSHHLPKQSSEESQDDLKLSDLKDIPSTGGHDLDFDSVDHSGCRRLKIVHETSRPLSDIEFNRAKKYLYTGEDSGSDDRDSEFSNFKRDFSYDILDDRRKRRQVDALLDPFGLPKHSEYSTRRYSDHYRKLNIKSLHLGGVAKKLDTEKIHQPATPMAIISADSVQLKKSKDIMLSPKTRLKLTKPLQLPEQNKESRYQKYISGAEKKKRLNKLDSDLEIDRVLMLKTLGSRSFDDESAISGSFEREQSTGSALSRSSQQFSMSHTFKTLEATSRSHSNTSRSLLDTGSDSDDEIMV